MARLTVEEKAQLLIDDPSAIDRVSHPEVEAYRVISPTSGKTYFVIVELGKVDACTCPAGQFGRTCYHGVAIDRLLKKVRR